MYYESNFCVADRLFERFDANANANAKLQM